MTLTEKPRIDIGKLSEFEGHVFNAGAAYGFRRAISQVKIIRKYADASDVRYIDEILKVLQSELESAE